jgi:hypothetical protein
MAKLNSKKQKKRSVLRRKKFGRIDSWIQNVVIQIRYSTMWHYCSQNIRPVKYSTSSTWSLWPRWTLPSPSSSRPTTTTQIITFYSSTSSVSPLTGVNFTNILRAPYSYKSFMQSSFVLSFYVWTFFAQEYWRS